MKIERAQEIYSDYEEGSLSPAMKLAIEQHFQADPSAKRDYDDFSRVFELLSEVSPLDVEVPHGFRAKVMQRAAIESVQRQKAVSNSFGEKFRNLFLQPRRREATGVVAAVLAVAIVIGVFLKPVQHPGTKHVSA